MKKIKLAILFLFLFVSLEANYCVQVSTADRSGQDFIVNEAKSINYNQFSDVRVERRGNYFVFRIGDFQSYDEADIYNKEIRQITKGSYVRKCDLEREQVVFSKNGENNKESLRDEVDDRYTVEKNYNETVDNKLEYKSYQNDKVLEKNNFQEKRKEETKLTEKKYIDKSELVYSSKNNQKSLWDECKKCFAPMYEEEEKEYEYEKPKQRKSEEYNTVKTDEIEVRVQEKQATKKSFWVESINENEKNNFSKKSKYGIDDEYLP